MDYMSKIGSEDSTLKAVDFFCSGGGMSFGIQESGIHILAGIDIDKSCEQTYLANIKNAEFICADVFELKETDLEKRLNLKKNDDNLILIGCSPCQFWSFINTDKTKSLKSKNLLIEFQRFVEYFMPGYVVVENVPGVWSRKEESGLKKFILWLSENGYSPYYKVHNVNDFGVPQNRKRFTLIANRVTPHIITLQSKKTKPLTVRDVLGEKNGFNKIEAGHKDDSGFLHTTSILTDINKKRIRKVKKDGGNRFDFADDPDLQLPCFQGKNHVFTDTFGRLFWDKPSPTITTKFNSISNGRFGHPEEDRGLSLREGATLQSFPKTYKFYGDSIIAISRIIGNAVPPIYAKCIGEAIKNNHQNAV